jgi:uncharacterized protein (TIGR02147 family)
MNSIFSYLDYRAFLRDWFEENKTRNSIISYRYLGNKLELDASFLVKVFQGQLHISTKSIHPFSQILKLNKRETEYFELLVHFNKSKKSQQTQILFDKLLSLRSPDAKILETDKYEFFSNWYTIAIYELLRFYPFNGDYKELGNKIMPPVTQTQAKDTIELLERLDLILKNKDDQYIVKDINLSTGEQWMSVAIRKYQKEIILLGSSAIDTIPKDLRDISTVTVSLSKPTFDAIRERIKSMRKELLEVAKNDTGVDAVYQINFQVFPVSKH